MVEVLNGQRQSALRKEQIEEAMRLQAPQLELLYRLGVAQMIQQEAGGVEIPPLVFGDGLTKVPEVDLERTREMTRPIFRNGLWEERWTFNPIPQQTDNGLPDTTLQIRGLRIANQQVKRFAYTRNAQSVLIELTEDGQLKVEGEKTTLNRNLTAIDEEGLAQVRAGIKKAFSNPHIELELSTMPHLE